jgi:hypothetical protein
MGELFKIDGMDKMTFSQGRSQSYDLSVRVFSSYASEVKYELVLLEGPTELGLTLVRTGAAWKINWAPGRNILNSDEILRKFPVLIEFRILSQSSARAKAQFNPNYSKQSSDIVLYKDISLPVIEDAAKISDYSAKATQSIQLELVAAAAGLNSNNELDVQIQKGPDAPTRELIQFDATYGIRRTTAQHVASLGKDKEGRLRYKYRIDFDAKRYNEALIESLNQNPVLKSRYEKGEITQSEAAFSIKAHNPNNSQNSADKIVIIKVDLPTPAAKSAEVKK